VLSRLCAAWLVALIILPFSAPFSTCDAASLFAFDDLSDQASVTIESVGAADDVGTTHALPVRTAFRSLRTAGSPVKTAVVPSLLSSEHHPPHDARTLPSGATQHLRPLRV